MSTVLDNDNEPHESETLTSISGEDAQIIEENISSETSEGQKEAPQDDQEEKSADEDRGGAGDVAQNTQKPRVVLLDPEEMSAKTDSFTESFKRSGSVSLYSKASGSKKNGSREGSQEAFQRGSLQSMKDEGSDAGSSGFQVVTQILEELIDEVVGLDRKSSGTEVVTQILEDIVDEVIKEKQLRDVSIETDKGSQMDHGEIRISSVTTIKSEDEQGSIEIDEELEAQLAMERETAFLQRQQVYQDNITKYHCLISERTHLKQKNIYLLKQMYEHYKRKKIEHLYKEMSMANIDMEGKYIKVLLAYEDARKAAEEEELKMYKQVNFLEGKTKDVEAVLEEESKNLHNRERDVAKGLISSQTVQALSDKTIECLIQRQIAKSKEVATQRHTYYKLRDIASADESLLKSLENLGENLTLMEYEQLKMQSQSCVEKLEERDADLHRLRSKATSAIQVLAEVREKTHTLQEDTEACKAILHDVDRQLIQTRERLGYEKKKRDMSRSDAVRLRQEAGLLSEPKLLQDYKESLAEKERLLQQLQDWKSKFESQKQNILGLRKTLTSLQQKGNTSE